MRNQITFRPTTVREGSFVSSGTERRSTEPMRFCRLDALLQMAAGPQDAPQVFGNGRGPARRHPRVLLLAHRLANDETAPGGQGVRQ